MKKIFNLPFEPCKGSKESKPKLNKRSNIRAKQEVNQGQKDKIRKEIIHCDGGENGEIRSNKEDFLN